MTFVFDSLDILVTKKDGCLLGEPSRRNPVLPGPAPPRRPAGHRPAPTRPWYAQIFPDILRMKRVYKDKKASVYLSASKYEERPSSHG